ncbi:uncharacterized protein TNIN_268211 [Trichonephila inaurata madagascariensis]|uniref:Uncharacterized protein n=1 Tax=Trichonephila inaurata madagascariensis TaxID=2747483 RepID=A0A8X7CNB7_9ARAC|nr:uncharacterized protein TNIN_268211 [Trichonephila inaurata madagascariensis]
MEIRRSSMGEIRRFLALIILISFSVVLAPTVMAPPERNFSMGQPELQQSMDNMAREEEMIKRNLKFPSGDVMGYPALLTHKTSDLLSEAEHMLNRVKNLRERRWVEAFIHRLKLLAAMLERSVIHRPGEKLTVDDKAIASSKKTDVLNDSTLQTPPPLQETALVAFNEQQKMMTKYPVAAPPKSELLAMKEVGSERQEDMKSDLTPLMQEKKSEEEDELVKELEDLHKIAYVDNQEQSLTPPTVKGDENVENLVAEEEEKVKTVEEVEKVEIPAVEVVEKEENLTSENAEKEAYPVAEGTKKEASPAVREIEEKRNPGVNETKNEINLMVQVPEPLEKEKNSAAERTKGIPVKEADTSPIEASPEALPPKRMMSPSLSALIIEDEKAKIKQNLAREIAELERLGESEEQILNELHQRNGHYLVPGPRYQHGMLHPTPNTGTVVSRYEDQIDPYGNVRPLPRMIGPSPSLIPYPRANYWRPPPAMYPGYRPFRPTYINNSAPGMHMGMFPMNHPMYNRQFPMGNIPPQANMQLHHEGIKETIQKLQQDHQNFLMNNPAPGMPPMSNLNYRPNTYMQYPPNPSMGMIPYRGVRPMYTPYPYMPNQNFTANGSPVYGNGFAPNPYPNHNINNGFNDEMKRELRDGKVILLSDSVVRSNFQQDDKKNPEGPNETKDGTIQENKTGEKNGTKTE